MAFNATDLEYAKGIATPYVLSGSETWVSLTASNVVGENQFRFNVGDIDAAPGTICIRYKLDHSVYKFVDQPLTKKTTLSAATNLSVTATGNRLNISATPDLNGASHEIEIMDTTTSVVSVIPKAIDDYTEQVVKEYATEYRVRQRTIGDGVKYLTSPWSAPVLKVTDAAPANPPSITVAATYAEKTGATGITGEITLSLNPAPATNIILQLRRTRPSTWLVNDPATEPVTFPISAGKTIDKLYYHYYYSSYPGDVTELVFEVLPGDGYVVGSPSSATHPVTYTGTTPDPTEPETIDIRAYGTPTGNDTALIKAAADDAAAQGKRLLIPPGVVVVPRTEVRFDQNGVFIVNKGEIKNYTPKKYLNDWMRDAVTGAENGYTWSMSQIAGSPANLRREEAKNATYRLFLFNGDDCGLDSVDGLINGGFDNTGLKHWGATSSGELVAVYGDRFTSKGMKVNNAGGNAIRIVSDYCDLGDIHVQDAGYTGLRIDVQRNMQLIKFGKVTGGKTSMEPNSRTSTFTINGTNTVELIQGGEVILYNGAFLCEGVVGNENPGAYEVRFKRIELAALDITMNVRTLEIDGSEAVSKTFKFENVGDVITPRHREWTERADGQMSASWMNLISSFTSTTSDLNIFNYRPAPVTRIGQFTFHRTNGALPQYYNIFDIRGSGHSIHLDNLTIQNNGYPALPANTCIFKCSDRANLDIWVKDIVNVGKVKISLAALNSATTSGCIRIGVGLTVTQQKALLAEQNIYVSSNMSRLLADS